MPTIAELVIGDNPEAWASAGFTVDDLDVAGELLGPHVGAPKDAIQPGRRVAMPKHEDLGISVPILFISASASKGSPS